MCKKKKRTKEWKDKCKNTLEGINNQLEDAEEWITNPESGEWKVTKLNNKKKSNENKFRDHYTIIKHNNIHIIEIPKGEEIGGGRKFS